MPLKQHHQDEAFNRAETSMARKLSIKRTSTENLAARAKTPVAPPPSASANLTVGSQQGVLGQRAMTPNSYYEMEEAQYRPQKFDKEKFKRANKEKNQEPGHAAQDVSRTDQLASAAAFRLELHAAAPLEASAAKPVYLDETDEDLMNEILGTA
ncbi:hypothetical protein BC831DRAFT_480633 [Entophlyctis helioformis]|nr:hypothetical protein BC831DRAFT_480633 [Entophlyctis helioformis]